MIIPTNIALPDMPTLPGNLSQLKAFFSRVLKSIQRRDAKIALAINAADIEVVSSEPSGEPNYVGYHWKRFNNNPFFCREAIWG